jgi:FkbM family methyltransferase
LPNRTNVDVYAIEANPSFAPQLEQMFRDHPNILGMFTKTAVSNATNPVGLSFAVTSNSRRGPSTSSTLVFGHEEYRTVQRQAKAAGESVRIVVTPSIDVCSLLRDEALLTPDDHVVVKVDVEGADHVVLSRIAKGCSDLVDTIAFEGSMHGHALTPELKSLKIAVRPWA